eukprot:CAMPEP_0170644426 /NCGR_PEP_ID=MMETSP0224-20130122/42477_1 /TAXON_ID=285029 /ORGANISM="Togula jolla, Strain CCCM 725" /LENGTH=49 /DNA_ID= /DNA_START= /DNA_END= /DNA_ORIENTATION=
MTSKPSAGPLDPRSAAWSAASPQLTQATSTDTPSSDRRALLRSRRGNAP